ncbi:MAG TPA: FAD-dependent oxidoreductase [Terriglobia bacterium]|nr:FAD-dependent oxidoreductase [Terriglobia bacterium]
MPKPAVLIADRDPVDLHALAEALSARYGFEYDVRTAGTATDARSTLSEAETTFCLIFVSRNLPDEDPLALLDYAHQLHPDAKRVLCARYIDTSAPGVIATAMRSGQIDHFLYVPWEPRAERLYPMVDDLLADLRPNPPDRGFEVLRIVGERWSPRSHQMRDRANRARIPFGFYDSDSEEGKQILAEAGVDGSRLPVVVFQHGTVLVDPSVEQVAQELGVKTRPDPGLYDVTIVGAGPAGLAAAVYGASEGLRTLLIEPEIMGGQAGTSSRIENYLGFPRGISGSELARKAFEQTQRFGASIIFTQAAAGLRGDSSCHVVMLSGGSEVESRAVVVATGMAYRLLGIPSLERFQGAGVYYGAAMSEAPSCSGQGVVIVGAGNSAGQAAVYLAKFASQVTLLVRGKTLAASMSDYLIHQLSVLPNISIRFETAAIEGHGDRRLSAVTVEGADGTHEELSCVGLYALIGGTPHSQWLAGRVERDAQGYVITGRDLLRCGSLPKGWPVSREPYMFETSVPGVFAVGDVRFRSVKRVASAVGEGAASIQEVHEFLASG